MILKETILSAFTERGTLLKWLKKVEAALNNAVLTDISVEQVSATQVKLKFTFENGDFVESPVLTLPRGEKGEKGEDGKDGLDGEGIAATIEVGTVTTGAAGTNASVTNVGTEQRAVLNFVIPRGDTGASGEQGSAGVGFDDADQLSINDGEINITADDNGVNIEASFEVAVGEEILEIPSTMYLPLKGSESIVIDVDESGDFIDIHLDADIAAKLGRVLVTPMSAPASVSLVAVDTSNAQTMLTLGDGLSVSGGVLSASGGGGGVGKLYLHNITFGTGKSVMCLARSNDTSTHEMDVGKILTEGALLGMVTGGGRTQSLAFSFQGYGLTRLTAGFSIYSIVYNPTSTSPTFEKIATNDDGITSHTCEEFL